MIIEGPRGEGVAMGADRTSSNKSMLPPPKKKEMLLTFFAATGIIISLAISAVSCAYIFLGSDGGVGSPSAAPPAGTAPPATSASPSPPSLSPYGMSPADIQKYLADCARGTNNFKEGSGLTYPQRMDLEVNRPEIYKVTINLSGEGQPELIPNGEVGTVPITLQCQVKASLVPSDADSLDVPASGDGVRNFYPTGQVEWTWQVTAK